MGKVVLIPELMGIRHGLAEEGRQVVLTNGCFDLLHIGHVRYLRRARELGDALVVGVNSDDSVRKLKGPGRPVVPGVERAELLAALGCVDYVVVFNEDTAERLVDRLKPDVYVKGGDYDPAAGKLLPEAAIVAGYGGRIAILPFVAGRSTTELIRSIRQQSGD